ncbi:disease resistance protein RPV1-like [Cucumis melo]|uniref:ADP-ribosyl cyclase/cyclic ADP-ribose hydrolase n=1 Tax=Cucumis melo TaxID=3656 RepID=A0ABM3L630_CUCME|nr:disease resistance protein RPV1-like [Cucumis melo]
MASPLIIESRVSSIASLSSPPPPYSLSFPLPPLRNYDVFLSHRAKDTGCSFAADLHKALTSQGIVVYRDHENEEGRGKPLVEKMKAVEESRCSIVIFSENYGNLVCMKEIEKIVMCKELMDQLVLPIFYKIDPTNVRKQKGNFEKHFNEHEANHEIDIEEVESWRKGFICKGWKPSLQQNQRWRRRRISIWRQGVETKPSTKLTTENDKGFGGKVWKPSFQQNQRRRRRRKSKEKGGNRAFNETNDREGQVFDIWDSEKAFRKRKSRREQRDGNKERAWREGRRITRKREKD